MRKPLLVSLLFPWILAVTTYASVTSEEIATALDTPDVVWSFSATDSGSINVVPDTDRVGQSFVEISVAPQEGFGLFASLPGSGVVQFDFRLVSAGAMPVTVGYSHETPMGDAEIAEASADWKTMSVAQYLSASENPLGFRRAAYADASEPTKFVLQIDNVRLVPGYLLAVETNGVSVTIEPDKEIFQSGEIVKLRAEPLADGDVLLGWEEVEYGRAQTDTLPNGAFEITNHTRMRATAGRVFEFDGVSVVVPVSPDSNPSVVVEDAADGLTFDMPADNPGIRLRATGPGFVRFKSRRDTGVDSYYGGFVLGYRPISRTSETNVIQIGPGDQEITLVGYGDYTLWDFELEAGNPLSVDVNGAGTVAGWPETEGVAVIGGTEIEAVPDDGWAFAGWSGAIRSSESKLAVDTAMQGQLVANFYRETSDVGDVAMRLVGSSDFWQVQDQDGAKIARGSGPVRRSADTSLEWSVAGPGALIVEYLRSQGDFALFVDGVHQQDLLGPLYSSGSSTGNLRIEVTKGSHVIHLQTPVVRDGNWSASSADISVLDVAWQDGWPIDLRPTSGGTIQSNGTLAPRAAEGTTIACAAVADDGYSFAGWLVNGTMQSEADLSLVVDGPIDATAIFRKQLSAQNGLITSQVGASDWQFVDGVWTSPVGINDNAFSRIEGPAAPGSQLVFDTYGGNGLQLWWGINGVLQGPIDRGSHVMIDIPDYAETFFIEVASGEYYNGSAQTAFNLSEMAFTYPVEIDVIGSRLHANPSLTESAIEGGYRYTGQANFGETFSFTTRGAPLISWNGSLEGQLSSGEIVVNGPIRARGVFDPTLIETDGSDWRFENDPSIYVSGYGSGESLAIANPNSEYTLASTLEGPGVLELKSRNLEHVELQLDNGVVDALRSSLRLDKWIIPEGSHAAKLRFITDDSESWPKEYPQDGLTGGHWIDSIKYQKGYYIDLRGAGGNIDTGGVSTAVAGSSVTFEANASSDNEFVGWVGPISGQPNPFTMTIDGPTTVRARFAVTTPPAGMTWTFEGAKPAVAGSNYYYSLSDAIGNVGRHATSLVGPQKLYFIWEGDEEMNATARVDGVERSVTPGINILELEAGAHDVVWEASVPSGATEVKIGRFSLPKALPTFSASFYAPHADLEITGGKIDYEYGDEVVVTAPEINELGQRFRRWDINNNTTSTDRELRLRITGAIYATAVYSYEEFGTSDFIITGNAITKDDNVTGPSGGSSYEATIVSFSAEEDSWIRFFCKGGAMSIGQADPHRTIIKQASQTWGLVSAHLKAGHTLYLRNESEESYHIADVSSGPGWAPTIVVAGSGEVDLSPDFAGLSEDTTVSARPAANSLELFSGWYTNDWSFVSGSEVEIEHGDDTWYVAAWGEEVEQGDITVALDVEGGWLPQDLSTWQTSWKTARSNLEDGQTQIGFEVAGPSVLEFSDVFPYDSAEAMYFLDGEILQPSLNRPSTLLVPISDGRHRLEAVYIGNEDWPGYCQPSVYLNRLPGYLVRGGTVEGGVMIVEPSQKSYAAGDSVLISARADGYYQFDDWEEPYSGNDQNFYLDVSEHAEPKAIFEPKRIEFSAGGLDWIGLGVRVEFDPDWEWDWNDGSPYWKPDTVTRAYLGLDDSSLMTHVSGPAVARLRRHAQSMRIEINGKHIDEAPAALIRNEWEMLADTQEEYADYYYVALPEGENELKITGPAAFNIEEQIAVIPGYLLVADGLGCGVEVRPAKQSYRSGDVAQLRAVKSDPRDDVEWVGLPADAVVEGDTARFTVRDHTRIEAIVWRHAAWMETPLEIAGDATWNPSAVGSDLRISNMTTFERNLLKRRIERDGLVRLNRSLGDGILAAYYLNGEPVSASDAAGTMLAVSAGDELILSIQLTANVSMSTPSALANLDYLSSSDSPYLAWWERYMGKLYDNDLLDPAMDVDSDGLPNYVEFIDDSDPGSGEYFVTIQAGEDRPTRLAIRGISQFRRAELKHEYATSVEGPWKDAEPLLGPPVTFDNSGVIFRDIVAPEGTGYPVYFRTQVAGDLPTLEEAVGANE